VFDENTVKAPGGLYYDMTHTWAFMEKNGTVKIGIDDFLQHITGPLTGIKMKNIGETIKKGDNILSIIQNGKQINIYAPISGKIIEQNVALNSSPSIINSSPYSDGWVYLLKPSKWMRETQFLILKDKYTEWLKSEFSRLKDFLAVFVKPKELGHAQNVYQDGGELKYGILADLGPEIWEDFQRNFIDTTK
jgi:glycine cleavage system H lipoate-binding protein